MIFKYLVVVACLLMFNSCDYVRNTIGIGFSNVPMDTIVDYSTVDELPVFPKCTSLVDTTEKNRCFVNNLYNHFSESLLRKTFRISEGIHETVVVKIRIDKKGVVSLMSIESSHKVKEAIPTLENRIQETVVSLPKLFPALKRGIPVQTVFELPIVLELQ
jgi:hypothetical protein